MAYTLRTRPYLNTDSSQFEPSLHRILNLSVYSLHSPSFPTGSRPIWQQQNEYSLVAPKYLLRRSAVGSEPLQSNATSSVDALWPPYKDAEWSAI